MSEQLTWEQWADTALSDYERWKEQRDAYAAILRDLLAALDRIGTPYRRYCERSAIQQAVATARQQLEAVQNG